MNEKSMWDKYVRCDSYNANIMITGKIKHRFDLKTSKFVFI